MIVDTATLRKVTDKAVKKMKKTDVALTMIHTTGKMAVLNQKELETQLLLFKKAGCVVRKSNVREKQINGKTFYLFVIQAPDHLAHTDNLCCFAMSQGLMVSGIGYLAANRKALDSVIDTMGIEGATANPLFTQKKAVSPSG